MPINIHSDEMKAWKYIETHVSRILREKSSMNYDILVLNTIRSHPVGANQVDRHIKRFYIDTGVLDVENGMLRPPTIK